MIVLKYLGIKKSGIPNTFFVSILQVLGSPKGGLKSTGDVDLLENMVKVRFYRVRADAQLVGDLVVVGPDADER